MNTLFKSNLFNAPLFLCIILSFGIAHAKEQKQSDESPVSHGKNLGDILRDNKLEFLLGTWVDARTMGKKAKVTFSWRFQDKVLEVSGHERKRKFLSVVSTNLRLGKILSLSVDSDGNSDTNGWRFNKGDATFCYSIVNAKNESDWQRILFYSNGKNILSLSIDKPFVTSNKTEEDDPIHINMVRVREAGDGNDTYFWDVWNQLQAKVKNGEISLKEADKQMSLIKMETISIDYLEKAIRAYHINDDSEAKTKANEILQKTLVGKCYVGVVQNVAGITRGRRIDGPYVEPQTFSRRGVPVHSLKNTTIALEHIFMYNKKLSDSISRGKKYLTKGIIKSISITKDPNNGFHVYIKLSDSEIINRSK